MRTWIVLAAAALLFLTLPACSACGQPGWSNCCQSWDFYEECDLIEGRRARCCAPECYDECTEGMVTESMVGDAVPPCSPDGQVIIEEEIIESGPQAGDIVETTTIDVAPVPAK